MAVEEKELKEAKAKKPKKVRKKMSAKWLTILWTPFIVLNLILCIAVNYLGFTTFFAVANRFFGSADGKLVESADNKLIDANYYTSDFDSTDDLNQYERELCEQIAEEGVVVLENKGLLPMADKGSLSLFSQSSVNLIYGGTGSGTVNTDACVNLKTALEEEGYTVNQKLWDFYETGKGSAYKRGEGAIMYGQSEDWHINECPLSEVLAEDGMEASFKDTTAVFVLSRTGGEGKDLARGMYKFTDKPEDQVKNYLEPNSDELEILDYLNKNFEDVLLIVNTNNAMELGWVKDFDHIKGVISCPGVGLNGTEGLAKVISGAVSPSGKLVDTFVYDNFSSPASINMGDFEFTVNGKPTGINFVNYVEGIYVGYRYYETRYEDLVLGTANVGSYDYDNTVLYPFGYGLSYTEFAWSNYSLKDNGDKLTATITVKNTGDVAGKDVVELYFNSPYTEYDITNAVEKSAVELAGFAKTDMLEPGESQTLTIEMDKEALRAYDYTNAKSYILDAGDYYITAAGDAHQAANNVLLAKEKAGKAIVKEAMVGEGDASLVETYTVAEFDGTTYATDSTTGAAITNQFNHAHLENTVYLTRNNWEGTYPVACGEPNLQKMSDNSNPVLEGNTVGFVYSYDVSGAVVSGYYGTDSLNPDADNVDISDISYGVDNGMELLELRGAAYDDPRWDALMDQLTEEEVNDLIHLAGYQTTAAPSINKPLVQDYDGPAGLNAVVGHAAVAMAYPCEVMIASTWNEELANAMGKAMGEDGLATNIEGWYAPAVNIHRDAFAGRNFEYYSEDPFMAGTMAANAIKGAASKGMYSFIKHFALNDQEDFRNGMCTFANEQSIREIYLEAFERGIKGAGTVEERYYEITKSESGNEYKEATAEVPAATAVMSSFNRIGTTWAGGNYNLLTGVLRTEWGFNGMVLTDYDNGGYMNTTQCVLAGGDAKLAQFAVDQFSCTATPGEQAAARNAVHHILYTVVNSSGMNGYALGTSYSAGASYATPIIIGISFIFALIAILGIVKVVRRHRFEKREKECKVIQEN